MKKILFLIVICFSISAFGKEIRLTKKQTETLKDSFKGYPEITKKIQEKNKDKN